MSDENEAMRWQSDLRDQLRGTASTKPERGMSSRTARTRYISLTQSIPMAIACCSSGRTSGGVPLEVVGAELGNGGLLVFHVMRLRERYRYSYLRVMAWQKRR